MNILAESFGASARPFSGGPSVVDPMRALIPPAAGRRPFDIGQREPAVRPATHGPDLAKLFGLDAARTRTTAGLKTANIAVTRLVSADRGIGWSAPLPIENTHIVALLLRGSGAGIAVSGARRGALAAFPAGTIAIAHLEDEPVFHLPEAFELLLIQVPRMAFEELAELDRAPRITHLPSVIGAADPVVHDLGRALLPCFENVEHFGGQIFDQVMSAILSRLAARHGQTREAAPRPGIRLNARELRIAKEMLVADLTDGPPIDEIAIACGMSTGRFVRAFRRSTGHPPHRWLRGFRVERAKELLIGSRLSLAQIAYDCGFADQSHFSRVFTAAAGVAPGAWRRARRA